MTRRPVRLVTFQLAVRGVAASALMTIVACASAPAGPPTTPAQTPRTPPSLDERVGWLLRLEQQRILRDPDVTSAPPPAAGLRTLVPAASPDLTSLSLDANTGVRRRAVLALGRVGVADALPWLVSALEDADVGVREDAAFALGLLRSPSGVAPLVAALADPEPLVRGRAAEGLALIGDQSAAEAIASAFAGCGPILAPIDVETDDATVTPEAEACRLSLFALTSLRSYDALARVALDASGGPVSRWWPVAYALQRIGDPRTGPALLALAASAGVSTQAFALRGLGDRGEHRAAPIALALISRPDAELRLRVVAARALAHIGGADAVMPLAQVAFDPATPPNLALEAVTALGALGDRRVYADLVDLFTSPWAAMRSAAMASAAAIDPDGFLLVLSSLPPDPDQTVRVNLAGVLARLPDGRGTTALDAMATDADVRVLGPVLAALAHVKVPDLSDRLFRALTAADFVVRETAARLVGAARVPDAAPRLAAAYERGLTDAIPGARSSALGALAAYGLDQAGPTLRAALSDPDWSIRLEAAAALGRLGETQAAPVRPAPLRDPVDLFGSAALLHPTFSPHAFIETRHGTIELELNVVDAPMTTRSFIALARAGFFNGIRVHRVVPNFVVQAGDPRGDGEGGPGYTIRDEFSTLPYVRGTVGMALAGPETGGSQFFITLSPQPHLAGRYTVFGRVVAGEALLDQISALDVIERVRIWDGVTFRD